jgi:ribosomal protein S17E
MKQQLLEYIANKVIEKHETCLTDEFDNGYFWAMKELQSLLLKGEFDDNK